MYQKGLKLLFGAMILASFSKVCGQMYISPQKYTSTAFTAYNVNSSCYGSGLEMYVNDVKITNFTYGLCNYGICQFRFPFGTLAVGDQLKVKDACGNFSNFVYIEDDFVYVEVPWGASYSSNGIGPLDEGLPYSRLSNRINVGKCQSVDINSHALHNFEFFVTPGTSPGTYSTGVIKVNGTPIENATVTIDKTGINTSTIQVAAGVIQYNNTANIKVNQNFSGRTPTTIEYIHNGVLPFQDQEFGFGPLRVRLWSNARISVYEYNFDGSIRDTEMYGDYTNSSFKITFDLGYFRLFIDNIEKYAIKRTVLYSSSSGSISNGSILEYGTPISWNPSGSGVQWVGAFMDGIRYTRQYFNVAEDMVINESLVNVACNGSSTGSITLNVRGGQAPLQYSKDGVIYSGSPLISGLSAGNYTVYVRDASGCLISKSITITENPAMNFGISSIADANCIGLAGGSATLSASGGSGFFQYSLDNVNFQNSATFTNLIAGNYTFYVKDASGCTKSVDGRVGTKSSMVARIGSQTNLLCNADNTGNITLANTGTAFGTIQYSKDGLTYQSSASFGSLSAGTYTLTLKDDLCTSTISTTVTEPSVLSISGTIDQQVSCFAGANGQITTTATGGTTPYTFSADADSYGSSNVFSALAIGNYKYWAKDQNGCIAATPIYTITQPTEIVFSVSAKTEVSCYGGNDGTVTLLSTGGVPSYQYSKDNLNFQASEVFSGLNEGLKNFYVKDQNACIKTVSTTILQPTVFTLSVASSNNLVCNGISTGKVLLSGTGGTTPYTYFNTGGSGQASPAFETLAAGAYTFSAKDAKNCEVILPALTLTQPSPILIQQILKTDVDCETYAKGALAFVASGSNGGFSYTLSGINNLQQTIASLSSADGQFNNLTAGNYLLTARDQYACEKTYLASVVPKNSSIRFDLNITKPSACLSNDGSISISNVSGGRPAYSYRISSQGSFGSANNFTGLGNGNYIITVADDLCSYNKEADLRLPNGLSAGYTITPQSCTTPNANVSIAPISGGSGSYQLAIYGVFSSNTSFTDLSPNTYTVLIKDHPLTCQTALSFEIKEQNRADLKTAKLTNISCFGGSDGFIQAIGDNNLSPFTYSFNTLSDFSSNNNFSGLPIGTYRIFARNSIGCLDSIRVTLNQPTKIAWEVIPKNNDCFGDKTGEILITGTGGTPPYQYSIEDNFIDNDNFTGLLAGNYLPAIKDSKACLFQQPLELLQPTELMIKAVYKDTITCFGENNGVILINAEGGTPTYTYALQNENFYDIEPNFKDLVAGNYKFFVRDSKQCLKETELLITEPEKLDLSLMAQTDPLCIGEKNGSITLKANGGNNGGYTYTMDNSLKQLNNGLFENLSEGNYTFKVEDRKACFDTVTAVRLTWPKALAASLSQKQPVCFGDANGQISIAVNGGVGGYSAKLLNQNNLLYDETQLVQNTFDFGKLPAGIYQFAVKDRNGCQLTIVEQIAVADKLESNINLGGEFRKADSVVVCKGQTVTLNAQNPGKEIEWYKDGIEIKEFRNQNIIESYQSAIYKVIVKNNTGCEVRDEFKFLNNNIVLKTDFLIPSQAITGDTVVLLDQTFPQPDINTWLIPSEIKILEKNNANISLIFNDEKSYKIGLQAKKDDCVIVKYYDIDIFNEKNAANTKPEVNLLGDEIILDFKIAPNPNYGSFSIYYTLKFPMIVNLVLTSAQNGSIVWRDKSDAKKEGKIDVKINNYMPGVFNLTLTTGNAQKTIKILLMR
jgi:hypothetical protein